MCLTLLFCASEPNIFLLALANKQCHSLYFGSTAEIDKFVKWFKKNYLTRKHQNQLEVVGCQYLSKNGWIGHIWLLLTSAQNQIMSSDRIRNWWNTVAIR